jgi:hypothetical protein
MIDRLLTNPRFLLIAGAAASAVALAFMLRPKEVAESIARTAVGMAEGTATGVVVGIGSAVGVPETDQTQCQKDLAAGNTWAASFSCPAKQFLTSFLD